LKAVQANRSCLKKKKKKKNPSQKRAGGVAQGVGPEFKPQYRKKKVSQYVVQACLEFMILLL
jgi:hypothetical protein